MSSNYLTKSLANIEQKKYKNKKTYQQRFYPQFFSLNFICFARIINKI